MKIPNKIALMFLCQGAIMPNYSYSNDSATCMNNRAQEYCVDNDRYAPKREGIKICEWRNSKCFARDPKIIDTAIKDKKAAEETARKVARERAAAEAEARQRAEAAAREAAEATRLAAEQERIAREDAVREEGLQKARLLHPGWIDLVLPNAKDDSKIQKLVGAIDKIKPANREAVRNIIKKVMYKSNNANRTGTIDVQAQLLPDLSKKTLDELVDCMTCADLLINDLVDGTLAHGIVLSIVSEKNRLTRAQEIKDFIDGHPDLILANKKAAYILFLIQNNKPELWENIVTASHHFIDLNMSSDNARNVLSKFAGISVAKRGPLVDAIKQITHKTDGTLRVRTQSNLTAFTAVFNKASSTFEKMLDSGDTAWNAMIAGISGSLTDDLSFEAAVNIMNAYRPQATSVSLGDNP